MSINNNLPSYEELFGQLNFKKSDDARSVYSPAAYLSDLLQMLDDKFENPDLDERRADLKKLLLDGENTFALIPYLDIVNEVLEKIIGADPYDVLRAEKYSFNLPFSLENEKVKKYLHFLNVSPETLHKRFSIEIDYDVVAREYLGLSIEAYNFIEDSASSDEAGVKIYYGLGIGDSLNSLLKVDQFMLATGLSGEEVRELLFQQLSLSARNPAGEEERIEAGQLFINHELNGYAGLDLEEENIVWHGVDTPVPWQWFERISRLVRTAGNCGLSLTELDLILRSCCDNQLDKAAVRKVAMVKQFKNNYELTIAEACALFSDLNILGISNEDEPQDLFNQVFNVQRSNLEGRYIPAAAFIPQAFSKGGYTALVCEGDILSEENQAFYDRVCIALNISGKELQSVVEKIRGRSESDENFVSKLEVNIGLSELSLLFRITKMAEVLDTSYDEVLSVMDILERDPAIRNYNNFNILIEEPPVELNCYKIIEGNDVAAKMWLVQILFCIIKWMQDDGMTATELKQIHSGVFKSEEQEVASQKQRITLFDSLYQAFKPVFFEANNLKSGRFDQRSADVIHRSILAEGSGLTSSSDARLLSYDKSKAENAAFAAIRNLGLITVDDFKGLGIEEKILDKVFDNLFFRGYIDLDGALIEDKFPENSHDFIIATDFSLHSDAIFNLINGLYQQTIGENSDDSDGNEDIEFSLFLSDLETLSLTKIEKSELYDNLSFNAYIDSEGSVLQREAFADASGVTQFKVNVDISRFSKAVFDRIQRNIARFDEENLRVKAEIFELLAMNEADIQELIENLKFNEYIDEDGAYLNKNQILSLDIKDFNLALAFYPYRHQILGAIQQALRSLKLRFYTVSKAMLSPVADEMVAQLAFSSLKNQYFPEGQIEKAKKAFFVDTSNVERLQIGAYFTGNYSQTVFKAMSKIIAAANTYLVSPEAMTSFNFDETELDELMGLLLANDYINSDGQINIGKIPYLLNINNALEFSLSGFEDYDKDIFFVLSAIAREIDSGVQEISAALKKLAETQKETLFLTLQDGLGMQMDVLEVVCRNVFRNPENSVEPFLIPILNTVDRNDHISAEPDNHKFNASLRRISQFALLDSKLKLDRAETEVIFHDQGLAEKFPENLVLPQGMDRFDALLEGLDGKIIIFKGDKYWSWWEDNYNLADAGLNLSELSDRFVGLTQVDAAFIDENRSAWLISGTDYFVREQGKTEWQTKARIWGEVDNHFNNPVQIDASYMDAQGKTYLFSGTQYIRYLDAYDQVDEGYPKSIKGNWQDEVTAEQLPSNYCDSIGASFQGLDDRLVIFKGNHYVTSDDYTKEAIINADWGKVKNKFTALEKIDAAYADDNKLFVFAGDQAICYSNCIENENIVVDEGFPLSLKTLMPALPEEFSHGIDAVFKGMDGQIHLFKEEKYVGLSANFATQEVEAQLESVWGKVRNNLFTSGKVDAAFTGLDGRSYIFSGDQYFRYSNMDYSRVDESYPRTIALHWGGLRSVDAAFILDGKTYLFGQNESGTVGYVRYSTSDYTQLDEGYPKTPNDNWWNLPYKLVEAGFSTPDAVFIGLDGNTYLFYQDKFVYFEKLQRWWSEPQKLKENWDSIPFDKVDAAFTGVDGKTYLFSNQDYIRYSDNTYDKFDDRYPLKINEFWGRVTNNIQRSHRVDAAVVVQSREKEEDASGSIIDVVNMHTYLFSGDQFFRYKGTNYNWVEEGYPRQIKSALKQEPRFKHLEAVLENRIDAVFADQRNVYICKDETLHVISDEQERVYESILPTQVTTAFIDESALYIEDIAGWKRTSSIESNTFDSAAIEPGILRGVDPSFKNALDAVLKGTDGNTYLFKGQDCYNVLLEKFYPLKEEWGKVYNTVQVANTLDAIFQGADGKVYLFSGDQFLSYTLAERDDLPSLPDFVDENPKPIVSSWGGLSNISLAFIKESKTYLFEKADDDGNARYVCYSGSDYSKPDPGYPQTAPFSWWEIPNIYREEGFDRVDAVMFEGDNMYLFKGKEFIHFDQSAALWAYPRPVEQIWRGIPWNNSDFQRIKTVFAGNDGVIHFFSNESVCRYDGSAFSGLAKIKDRWGKINNNIEKNGHIDAAVVFGGEVTYLVSGDQYVRYSSTDYRYVDQGYPKSLLVNLRQEEAFRHLPETFEDRLEYLIENNQTIDAMVANSRNIYIFDDSQCHVASQTLSAAYALQLLGQVRNTIQQQNKVDAALINVDSHLLLFSGDQYVRYSGTDYDYVDEGYPKTIAQSLSQEEGLGSFAQRFNYNLDAAFHGSDGHTYLFKDEYFYSSGQPVSEGLISDAWGKVNNNFHNPGDTANITIDAALYGSDGYTYLFKGQQYLRYSNINNEYVDEGYPKAIKNNWGNMAQGFDNGIEGAFVFEEKTYLVKGDEHIRYSEQTISDMDRIYPQKFISRWGKWADFLLTDIKVIHRYKRILEDHSNPDYSLTDFLNPKAGSKAEPYLMLAEIFDWDIDDVKWLKRNNAFLSNDNHLEARFNLELVLRIFDIFNLTDKMAAHPSEVYQQVWSNLYPPANLQSAADTLYKFLGWGNSPKDWKTLSTQIREELNEIKRDALLPYVISQDSEVENPRDLYSKLLIDVEMGSCATTSRIKEALAAVQLYFHRYFVNLELIDIKGDKDDSIRQEMKEQWTWMKNYRVWEANRKVFLYPENYIRPELRDTKTPAFKTLEEDLLQGDITDAALQGLYKKYLDEYTEVSRLTIAGGYVYENPERSYDQNLILFGRTKTDPLRYYYRNASFVGGATNSATWEPWFEVNIQIEAPRVYPVYAFGRVFVFWAKVETEVEGSTETTMTFTETDGGQEVKNNARVDHILKVYYSFYNLNKEWVPAQLLDTEIRRGVPITSFSLYVENAEKIEDDAHENIIINCHYEAGGSEGNQAYYLTPELYTKNANKPDFANSGAAVFSEIFHESIGEKRVVMLNTFETSADGPWFSFDHKGGSFLVKPATPGLGPDNQPKMLDTNNDNLPRWPKIDATFHGPDGKSYFFRNDTLKYASSDDVTQEIDISNRWGKVPNNVAKTGVVDAAFYDGNKTYLFSGNEYLVYSSEYELADRVNPHLLKSNTDGFPRWNKIDAVLNVGAKTWFFNKGQFVQLGALKNTANVVDRWGKVRNSFTDPGESALRAGFVFGESTYLFSDQETIKYTGSQYGFIEAGYPKANSLHDILAEMGVSDFDANDDTDGETDDETDGNSRRDKRGKRRRKRGTEDQQIIGAYNSGEAIYLITNQQRIYRFDEQISEITDGEIQHFAELNLETDKYVFSKKSIIHIKKNGKPKSSPLKRSIHGAFLGQDDKIYLFSKDEFISFDKSGVALKNLVTKVNEWDDSKKNSQKWGKVRNKVAETGQVDAAFHDGAKTWLFSGNEYLVYSNGLEFADPGYPKAIKTNSEGLPLWTRLDAAFKGSDDKTYFFNNATKKYAVAGNVGRSTATQKSWGIIKNRLAERGVDAAYVDQGKVYLMSGNEIYRYSAPENQIAELYDSGYPSTYRLAEFSRVNAAFAYNGHFYLVSDEAFVRCSENMPYEANKGYPKRGRLGAILEDLEFTHVSGLYANMVVNGAYIQGSILYIHSHGYTFGCELNAKLIFPLNNSKEYFEAAYFNQSYGLQKLKNESYDAALVINRTGTKTFLLFKGEEYMETTSIPNSFADIAWSSSGKIFDKWDIANIDASYSMGANLYLFFRDKYFKLDSGIKPASLSGYKTIQGNWGNMAPDLLSGFDASLNTGEALYFFKDGHYIEYGLVGEGGEKTVTPYEVNEAVYDIIRLTTSTGYKLNQRLFVGGVDRLLTMQSQEIDEVPQFSSDDRNPSTIHFKKDKVNLVPTSSHLDFYSANGIYYWEVFFHTPYLIAQALHTSQKFEDSKRWFEFIYDPTEAADYWKFLPFLAVDIEGIIDAGEGKIARLKELGVDVASIYGAQDAPASLTDLAVIFNHLKPIAEVFLGERDAQIEELNYLERLKDLGSLLNSLAQLAFSNTDHERVVQFKTARQALVELVGIMQNLSTKLQLMQNSDAQIQTYLDDPFDPHAIAALRKIAYRKAIVMAYVDNLLEWGDLLFRQYTRESINEARMLYILAYDLLGNKPQSLGTNVLSPDKSYTDLLNSDLDYDFLLYLENQANVDEDGNLSFAGTVHDSIVNNTYFTLPENTVFLDYWDRVEDRLYKIRHCLNILGIKQPLPLFQPPIDPMALVLAAASGGGLGAALAGMQIAVPHYRFSFMIRKAQELVQSLSQFGNDLLLTLEKRDAEELSLMQNKQEGVILSMTMSIKEAQVAEADTNLNYLKESRANAQYRAQKYAQLINAGLNEFERGQMTMSIVGASMMGVSAILKTASGLAHLFPESKFGVFILGAEFGGRNVGESIEKFAEALETGGDAVSMGGEAMGVNASFERMKEDWELQKTVSESEVKQLDFQINGAEWQKKIAQREIQIMDKEVEQNESITTFMQDKFTNQQLYQWMASKLSGLFFQTYKLAFDMSKAAEKAFQFERGAKQSEVNYITAPYWDSAHKGLLAGEALGYDLDRMEKAFIDSDARRFEINKPVSLMELDPLALLELRAKGVCEFSLSEALFNYDFQGHYCRQIKSISVTFDVSLESNKTIFATLTQLSHKTILEPDARAVKFLHNPKDMPPTSIRNNWRPSQQIALSRQQEDDGMFDARYDDERFLHFEGTGAVSSWRLELNGKNGDYDKKQIEDVVISLDYSALQGGETFANAVKGMLKPYSTATLFNLEDDFRSEWSEFKEGEQGELKINLTRDRFPNMASSKILGIYSRYQLSDKAQVSMTLNGDDELVLKDGQYLPTSGLNISSSGSQWSFSLKGNKSDLENMVLVLEYKASVK